VKNVHGRFKRLPAGDLALTKVVAKWETVQHWKQMLNYLDSICADRIHEAGVRQ